MSESASTPRNGGSSSGDTGVSRLDELRGILLQAERGRLAVIERRLADPAAREEDVSDVLAGAVGRSAVRDGRLAEALRGPVETALRASVRRDPGVLAAAVYPVLGPAIRRAIGEALRRLLESFTHALDHSLSWQGLCWRWEAWTTGRRYAEVVLYRTLVYRVEQVFLIHRGTGLLLLHEAAPGVEGGDEDLISGMLTAVRDFVRDSFAMGPADGLHAIHVGDFNLWIEEGPHAVLAVAIRGQAPGSLRERLRLTLEEAHRQRGEELAAFSGDAAGFERLRPELEGCLEARYVGRGRRGVPWRALGVALGLAGMAGYWGWSEWGARRRAGTLVDAVRAEPGMHVTGAEWARGRFQVRGWRDPLAREPAELARSAGMREGEVEWHLDPYLAIEPEWIVRRARARLSPPEGVELGWSGGVLQVGGEVPASWWDEVRTLARLLPGVDSVELRGRVVGPAEEVDLGEAAAALGRLRLGFEVTRVEGTGWEETLQEVAAWVRRIGTASADGGRPFRLIVTGHADRSGSEEVNARLSYQRAAWVRDRLVGLGVDAGRIEVVGMGSREPLRAEAPAAGENRRVTFSVRWEEP
ncbi:MAG: OmpA family protein [Verrucomicrobiae bacterium]|nr:OmpA family protein [Verrucomicrobiae bacterium]